ncbi:MAG: DUF3540 domain-containing protein [Acidobacteria bacterium]|nr:DUF3540 domain-containing protein [Acidobacteriota bacterium]
MNSIASALPLSSEKSFFNPAHVVEDERDDGTVLVRMEGPGPGSIFQAHVAAWRTAPLAAGDRVLVARNPSQELYVIGRLGPFRPEPQSPAAPRADDGACAVLAQSEKERRVLQVYSPRKELVFEYDPVQGKARVNISRGSLELSTEDGDIELRSARDVRIGGRAIEMNSHQIQIKAASARWILEHMETLAGTVVEKARNAYRTVEQLTQLKTGRLRTLVDQTCQFKSRKAFFKSDEDFKIKGEKIHLG